MLRRPVIIASLSVLALGTGTQARALTPQQVSSYLEASNQGCTLISTFPGVVGRVRGSDREVTVVRYGIEGCGGGGNNHGTPLAVLYDAGGGRVGAFENRLPLGEVSAVAIRNGVIVANTLEFAPSDPHCCPSRKGTYRVVVTGNQLTMLR